MEKIEKMEIIQTIENANIEEMCRACFEKCGEHKMLFENAENIENIANKSLGDVFFDVVKIEMTPDAQSSSPNRICLPCSKELISAYNFIQKSQQSHNRFLDYLKSANIKPSDCLSEFPIDIPNEPASSDLLQIKVEDEIMTDYTYPQDDEMFGSSCSDSESDDEPLLNKKGKLNKMQCTYCSRVFKRLDFLQNHQKKHEEEMKKNEGESTEIDFKLTCDDCGLSCTSKIELKKHRIANHPARVMSSERENSDSSANQNKTVVDKSSEAFFRLHGSEGQPETMSPPQPTVSKDNPDILMLQCQINNLKETCLKEFKEIKALILQQNSVKDTKETKVYVRADVERPEQRMVQQNMPMRGFAKIFPINSDDQLHTLNGIDDAHKLLAIATVKDLIYYGGLSANLNKVFGNMIAMNYNYEGRCGKKSLKDLASVNDILFRAACCAGYTMADYESDLRKGFKIMKNRYFKNECIRRKKNVD